VTPAGSLQEPRGLVLSYPNETRSVALGRRAVREQLGRLDMRELIPSAELVATELMANAVLHTTGPVELRIQAVQPGVRISVADTNPALPVVPTLSADSMTGRGLLLVRRLAARLGFDARPGGKVVWAELRSVPLPGDSGVDELIEAWADDLTTAVAIRPAMCHIELGDVPTDLLLDAKAHVDNLVREFMLAASGAQEGSTAAVPAHLAELIEAVVTRFSGPRLAIKRQALAAARAGRTHVRLRLELGAGAAEAGEAYLRALDEADVYCRAARLLTLETPPKHRVFRHWYVGEIIDHVRRAEAGEPLRPPQPFEDRVLEEIDAVAAAWATADRVARLYTVASALAGAVTPEAVAEAVLTEGAAALGASGGGLFLPATADRLAVPGTIGYNAQLVASLRAESPDAELPAAYAMRTGEAVWMESRDERDRRFPGLAQMEGSTVSMCAVPLRVGTRMLGAIRFSFSEQRLFDEDERRFVAALAAQAAQALDRAQLYQDRTELYQRLQRTLLPPDLPRIAGLDLAAAYHPLGEGMEVGGDFYDAWALEDGSWALALGDVCGTGPEAAGLSAFVRYTLRAVATAGAEPIGVLSRLNEVLLGAAGGPPERFCRAILGIASRAPAGGWDLSVATGGHPEPLLQRKGGAVTVVPTGGSLLGILPDVRFRSRDVHLDPGDRTLFYTDGASEARRQGRMLETQGLADALASSPPSAAAAVGAVESAVLGHTGGRLTDDMALLVVRVLEGLPG
jgi:serine phosphatase RsbU (regulator of sigma subunit)/anti-sigma regulatory factor (Ser/Thr protein kinase)